LKINLHGDRIKAQGLLGVALQEMQKLENYMSFNRLLTSYRIYRGSDVAYVIQTSIHVNIKRIDIYFPIILVQLEEKKIFWEPWNGAKDAICFDHTWRVGMYDTTLFRHDWAYCDGAFTLDPPNYDLPPTFPGHQCAPVNVTDLYWLNLAEGILRSDMRKTTAGNYFVSPNTHCVAYTNSYIEWQASLDTLRNNEHQGKENIQFDITCLYTGTFDDDSADPGRFPLYSAVYVELTDVDSNFVRLYFKADLPFLNATGQTAYLIGDGIVTINLRDWGLMGDIARIFLSTHNDLLYDDDSGSGDNWDRLVSYECKSIDIF